MENDIKKKIIYNIIQMNIFNKRTGRFNKSTKIARELRTGVLTLADIDLPHKVVWTGDRFNTEKTIKLKLKKGEVNMANMVLSDNRVYNPKTKRIVNSNNKYTAQKILIETHQYNIGELPAGGQHEVSFADIKSPKDFINYFTTGGRSGKYVIRFDDGRIYTLSNETAGAIEHALTNDVETTGVNSQDEIIEMMRGNDTGVFERLPPLKSVVVEGGFFPYFHKMPRADLTDFDIYQNYSKTKLDENCLVVALRDAGVDDAKINDAIINQAKCLFKCGNIPRCKLGKIADKLKVSFSLRYEKNPRNYEKFGDSKNPCINLGLVCSHYFHNKDTKYTKFAIEHFDTIPVVEGKFWGDAWANYPQKPGRYQYNPKKPKMDSYNLILLMLKNPERYLIDLSRQSSDVQSTPYYSHIKDITCLEYDEEHDVVLTEYRARALKKYADIVFYDIESVLMQKDDVDKHNELHSKLFDKKPEASVHKLSQVCYVGINDDHIHTINETEGAGKAPKKMFNSLCDKHGKTEADIKAEITEEYEEDGMAPPARVLTMWKKKAPKLVLYAHNGGYDLRFMQKYLWNFTLIQNGNSLICGTATYLNGKKWLQLEFRDTYKLISKKLDAFGEMFNLPFDKEYMPYHLFNYKNVFNNDAQMLLGNVMKEIPKKKVIKFLECCKLSNSIYKEKGIEMFDMMKYSEFYCKRDVEVMRSGFKVFRGWIKKALKIDCTQFFTIPSIAHEYFRANGCYDGCYEVKGVCREFINKALVGGRTMLCENKKQICGMNYDKFSHKKIADFDAVSLYPSAMESMPGFLMGKPIVIESTDDWKNADGYFVEIKINDIKKHRKFPMMSYVDRTKGTRNFSDITDEYKGQTVVVDKTMLGIWEEYHGVEYEFIRGYMFNDGHNPQIKTTIRKIFNNRLFAKNETILHDGTKKGTKKKWSVQECLDEVPKAWVKKNKDKVKSFKNPIQEIWKLCMNSGYGKALTRPHDTKDVYVNEDQYLTHIGRYYNWVKQAVPIESACPKQMWSISQIDPIDNHGNYVHIGIEILSQSKRIMADVMYLAEDNNMKMYITDTDSIHMNLEDVEPLGDLFKEKYPDRSLIGCNMGQFHTDFELKNCINVYSSNLIALGKKCYIDELIGVDKDTGVVKTGYHFRMKGVKDGAIKHKAKHEYNGDLMALYKEMYDGNMVEFDLTKGLDDDGDDIEVPCFEYHKSWIITSKDEFPRKIQFK